MLACGAAGLSIDALVMQHAQRSVPASPEAKRDDPASIAPPSATTAVTPATAMAPAATRDDFLRTLMQSSPTAAVTIPRVELPAASSPLAAEAPVALTLEGEYRAVKDRLLAWTAAPTAARLQEFTLARAPGGDGRIVADVVVVPPHAPGGRDAHARRPAGRRGRRRGHRRLTGRLARARGDGGGHGASRRLRAGRRAHRSPPP